MNKTLSIGLAGYSFTIEELAYIKLSDYLTALRKSLDANEVEEVMHDIEIRMVELFKESLGKREVINDNDVEKIMTQIGSPEIIEEQEEAYFGNESTKKQSHTGTSSERQLFRDPENAKIGGVCAGLGYYFGMDITWMRIIWAVLLLIAISTKVSAMLILAIYVLLWIVLPQAKSTSDFLKMKGQPINFDTIKEESGKIVDFANESTEKIGEFYQENKPLLQKTGNGLGKVIKIFFGALFGIIGLSLLFSSFAVLSGGFNSDIIQMPGDFQFYLQDDYLRYFGFAFAFLTVFIPALIFLFIAVRLISPKTKFNYTGYILGGLVFLWIIFLSLAGYKALRLKNEFTGNNETEENITINTASDSILVDYKKVIIPENYKSYGNDIYSDLKTIYEEDSPYLEVTKKEGKFTPYLIIKKEADGYNIPIKMEVPVEIVQNKILLPNYIKYPYEHKLRDYSVRYELVVPKNIKVIAVNDNISLSMNDEEDDIAYATAYDENDSTNTNSKSSNQTSISISSDDGDSITINGKKYHEKEADKILEKNLKNKLKNLENLKDVDIKIEDGKSKISIKTK
jgi:phage shock protein PspC (stress-responsive transcriptional regulator)